MAEISRTHNGPQIPLREKQLEVILPYLSQKFDRELWGAFYSLHYYQKEVLWSIPQNII